MRAVVVGTGFGARVHVPALRAAGFEVEALVGRDPERTARRASRLGVAASFTTLTAALSRPGVELVSIATPPATHAELAIEAAEAGRHFVCEKPFTLDAGEAAAVRDAAARHGVVAVVGHEFRFAEDRAAIFLALAQDRIGIPRLISSLSYLPLVADPATRMPEWWFNPEQGGGWLGASGSHLVDQVRCWLGEFEALSASLGVISERSSATAEDTFTVRFSLASGVQGLLHQSAGSWGPSAGLTRVSGSGGSLWTDGVDAWVSDASGDQRLTITDPVRLPAAPAPNADPRHRFTQLELPAYMRLYQVVAAMVAGGASPSPVPAATADDGVAEMAVLDAIRASSAAGGERVTVSGS